MTIDYRGYIQDNFLVRDKHGIEKPFIFNDVQNAYYDTLTGQYPSLVGARENIVKGRQQGFSTLIDAIFTVDFLLSARKKIPVVTSQIISHKDAETRILFRRVDFFIQSWCDKHGINRSDILKTDTDSYLEAHSGAELYIGTAGAKTLGRGGTLQNLHWSEVAFYPNTAILNASEIAPPAEQQILDGVGKIFRESTGNRMYDFFHDEYEAGKVPGALFTSRFFGWWMTKEYTKEAPPDWVPPAEYLPIMEKHGLTRDQMFWRWQKVTKPKDNDTLKALREYPNSDLEAFLAAGEQYFDAKALLDYKQRFVAPPMPMGNIA